MSKFNEVQQTFLASSSLNVYYLYVCYCIQIWKCKNDPTFYHSTIIPRQLSPGMVNSLKKIWQKLLSNHTCPDAQAQHTCLQMPVEDDLTAGFLSVLFVCVAVLPSRQKDGFFIDLYQNQSFKKLQKIHF